MLNDREVWAGMATLSSRDDMRQMAVNSLVPQVDRLIVADGDQRGDQAKFLACEHAPAGTVFLGVDDDLIYPPDYVETILAGLDRYPGCIVSFHGWNMDETGEWYVDNYRCLEEVSDDVPVHVAGTGVCGFSLDTIRPLMADFESVNADVWLALKAERLGIRRVVLGHPSYWLGYSQAAGSRTAGSAEKPLARSVYSHTRFKTGSSLDGSEGMSRALAQLHGLLYA